jgi:hypothetical protein
MAGARSADIYWLPGGGRERERGGGGGHTHMPGPTSPGTGTRRTGKSGDGNRTSCIHLHLQSCETDLLQYDIGQYNVANRWLRPRGPAREQPRPPLRPTAFEPVVSKGRVAATRESFHAEDGPNKPAPRRARQSSLMGILCNTLKPSKPGAVRQRCENCIRIPANARLWCARGGWLYQDRGRTFYNTAGSRTYVVARRGHTAVTIPTVSVHARKERGYMVAPPLVAHRRCNEGVRRGLRAL